jgi:hypothetical protein
MENATAIPVSASLSFVHVGSGFYSVWHRQVSHHVYLSVHKLILSSIAKLALLVRISDWTSIHTFSLLCSQKLRIMTLKSVSLVTVHNGLTQSAMCSHALMKREIIHCLYLMQILGPLSCYTENVFDIYSSIYWAFWVILSPLVPLSVVQLLPQVEIFTDSILLIKVT